MKYIQLIYNPVSGTKVFKSRLDYMIEVFQKAGYELRIHRTMDSDDFSTYILEQDLTGCQGIIVAGGDGSINHTVNAMKKKGLDCPLGVIPAGTANDYARHLSIPENINDAIDLLAKMDTRRLDVGLVNDKYFVNVCSGGHLIDVSQNIDPEWKNTFGKLAYYMKGIAALPKIRNLHFRITANGKVHEEKLFFFVVLNGSSAGGFNKLGELASMKDGELDFIGIKSFAVNDLPLLFTKIVRGEHLNDKNVLFFQSREILIENLEEEEIATDVDGEKGPNFPLHIEAIREGLDVIVRRTV